MRVLYFNNVCGVNSFYSSLSVEIKADLMKDLFYACSECFKDITDLFPEEEEAEYWRNHDAVIVKNDRIYIFEGLQERKIIARTNEAVIELFKFYNCFNNAELNNNSYSSALLKQLKKLKNIKK